MSLTDETIRFLQAARVGRLATVGEDGAPYLVPFCFVVLGEALWSPLDAKPKRVLVRSLRRVRNLIERPQVGVVVDRWSEDWSELVYVQLRGLATLVDEGADRETALTMLREKYPQYRAMPVIDENPTIRIDPQAVTVWGRLSS